MNTESYHLVTPTLGLKKGPDVKPHKSDFVKEYN